ncbi:MAG: hypothetical protein KAV43_04065 [Hadesarchaea archaeon]|nr:hypothetical protein [Hadesarchaea archaeon]
MKKKVIILAITFLIAITAAFLTSKEREPLVVTVVDDEGDQFAEGYGTLLADFDILEATLIRETGELTAILRVRFGVSGPEAMENSIEDEFLPFSIAIDTNRDGEAEYYLATRVVGERDYPFLRDVEMGRDYEGEEFPGTFEERLELLERYMAIEWKISLEYIGNPERFNWRAFTQIGIISIGTFKDWAPDPPEWASFP